MRPIRLLALAASLTLGAFAHAADFYGEFHVGTTRADIDAAATGTERVEGAYGLGVGVRYNDYFSTQLEWHTLGENADPAPPAPCPVPPCPLAVTVVYPEHAWVLRALPRLPLGERFAVELGIGYAKWEGDVDAGPVGFGFDGTDWLYSLGFEWRFAERWSATVETQTYDVDGFDLDWTGAMLRYRF